MAFFHALLLSSLVIGRALSSPVAEVLEGRAECNRNNINRCFDPTGTKASDVASRAAATAFCSSYLSIPVVTSVIATTTPVSSTTTFTTTTVATEISTTVTQTTTTTTLAGQVVLDRKRAVVGPPACLGTTYSPSQVSAACSCLNVVPSTTSITVTAPTSIAVSTSTVYATETTTTTSVAVSIIVEDPPCPSTADSVFTYSSEAEIRHFCYYDGVGITTPNFVDYHTPTLRECADLCASIETCVAADYEPGTNGLCEVLSSGGIFAYGAQYSVVIRSTELQPPA